MFPKNHPLHKIFNRHKLKLSYSCTPNPTSNVTAKWKTNVPLKENASNECSLPNNHNNQHNNGIIKECYRNHKTSFRHVNKRNNTELSQHVWKMKDAKIPFSIEWKVIRKCNPYNNTTKKCNLCLYEKHVIICRKNLCSPNKCNELASSCPYRNRYVLQNFKIM